MVNQAVTTWDMSYSELVVDDCVHTYVLNEKDDGGV